MQTGTHRLARQSGGVSLYAVVTVGVQATAGESSVEFSGSEFAWLKDAYGPDAWEWSSCADYRRGAVRGVQYALRHSPGAAHANVRVIVLAIHAHPAHSTEDSVAYAACFATSEALRVEVIDPPTVAEGKVTFPASG